MKKRIVHFMMMFVLVGGLQMTAFAIDDIRFVAQTGEKTFAVYLENFRPQEISLSIYNTQGNLVYRETSEVKKDFAKKFNLQSLETGSYQVKIAMADRMFVQPIEVTTDKVLVASAERQVIFKPQIKQVGHLVDINLLTADAASSLTLTDVRGKVVHTEAFDQSGAVHRRYNLKELPAGKYTLLIEADGQSYYEAVAIR